MNATPFTTSEKEEVKKYFGKNAEELSAEEFRRLRKQLRTKYHPDNFEKFEDETVREMATERFQAIERLSDKLEQYFKTGNIVAATEEDIMHPAARFAFDKMKIEVITRDKDLKYHLFGTAYRWLLYGDTYKIPGTGASIVMDEDHRGASIGYRETIRMYVTFGVQESTEAIIDWLYRHIEGRANSLLIHGEIIPIEKEAMLRAMRRTAFLGLEAGA